MSRTRVGKVGVLYTVALTCISAQGAFGEDKAKRHPGAIDFARQIRPILSENCFRCHGPDHEERKAKLRLDIKERAFGKLRRGGHTIVPGNSAKSELIARITAEEPSERMPPLKTNKRLTPQQVDLLRQWIDQGAKWSEHWAFVPPQRPALPKLKRMDWARNAIDHFILARLEKEGLQPSLEADRVTLIRRLTLDLTGLPPTPAEVDSFIADRSERAYEKVVERLLKSPHYGERLALDWLDSARYADTHGYHIDAGRDMSRWREWVIDAFNQNVPFNRFTVEQLAGDLLPNATLAQKIASGFNRNHMINFEGGAIPEEYHAAYIVDRVSTTATVWLGLTVACAQCHDHKYDPISQKEFYQLYAFFHNVPENGLDGSRGNASPLLKAPTRAQQRRLDEITAALKDIERQLAAPMPAVDLAQTEWEKTALTREISWTILEPVELLSRGGAKLTRLPDKSVLATGPNPATDTYSLRAPNGLPTVTALRLEALPDPHFAAHGPGRSSNGNIVLTNVAVRAKAAAVKIKAASADFSQKDYAVANAVDGDPASGWAIHPEVGKAHQAVFEFEQPLRSPGVLDVVLDFQSQFGQHQLGRFRLSVTDAPHPHATSTLPVNIQAMLRLGAVKRSAHEAGELRKYYRTQVSPAVQHLRGRLAQLQKEKGAIEKSISTTMVMSEMPQPRDTFMLIRGQYDKRGEKVQAALPAALPPLPRGVPANRLGLAKWLVDPSNPLTPRVAVNRYWQMSFGSGLVRTAADFGSQGEPPSHPELLDWLAVEFMQPSGAPLGMGGSAPWDTKGLVRLIVTSATYRQSSKVTPGHLAKDRENRLLGRGPRQRLQAEFIRDQALAVSGLLNRRIGGASVFPYQPAGLWQELASRTDSKNWSAQFFVQSHGQDLYRRSMYTFWKRTSPPPQMITFDAPDREV
jgi:mono/diheme cytochrome c family protein